jgi:hypothetical protein
MELREKGSHGRAGSTTIVIDPKFSQNSLFTRSTPLGVTLVHVPLETTGGGSAAATVTEAGQDAQGNS